MLAAVSPGGGGAWQPAKLVDSGLLGANGIISRTSVTADPSRPGRAWVMWSRLLTNPVVDGVWVSRTDNGGITWGAPVRVARPALPGLVLPAWQLVVLADGSLLASFAAIETHEDTIQGGAFGEEVPARAQVSRSTDGGATWSAAIEIRPLPSFVLARLAADDRGGAWFAWGEPGPETGRVRLAHSGDGGRSWSDPIEVASFDANGVTARDLQASVAVARDGAVGVSWYDRADGAGTLHHRFAGSTDGGHSWTRLNLGDAFQRETGGGNGDHPLGAYQGLASLGNHGFAALYVVGTGQGAANPNDVRFARIVR